MGSDDGCPFLFDILKTRQFTYGIVNKWQQLHMNQRLRAYGSRSLPTQNSLQNPSLEAFFVWLCSYTIDYVSNCIPLADCLTDVSLRESSQQAVDLRGAEVKTKIELLKRTLRIGIKCVELTAFAPGKWFADARALTEDASAVFQSRRTS